MNKIEIITRESEKAFLAEIGRGERLTDKAEKFVGAVALIIGLKVFNLDGTILNRLGLAGFLALLSFILLGGALVLASLSRRVLEYASYPRGLTLIDDLKGDSVSDDAASIKVAKMYLNLYDHNARLNDRRAKLLALSGILLVAGFLLAVSSHLTFIVFK